MIYSMTGFGRAEVQDAEKKITVEMKSVNHRYLDISLKMPKRFSLFDPFIRKVMKEYMERGKVDVFISYESFAENDVKVRYNHDVAAQYVEYARKAALSFGIGDDLGASRLLTLPEVITMEEVQPDEEKQKRELEEVLRACAEKFRESRQREGESLKKNLLEKLDHMQENVQKIEEREPQILEEYREKLRGKVTDLLGDASLDESRIAEEVVIFADKICTDEETVRLKSHIASMKKELNGGGAVGRKLDFLAQEMNREANTILSKSNDLMTSDIGIELKTEIEKIREQIQNIE